MMMLVVVSFFLGVEVALVHLLPGSGMLLVEVDYFHRCDVRLVRELIDDVGLVLLAGGSRKCLLVCVEILWDGDFRVHGGFIVVLDVHVILIEFLAQVGCNVQLVKEILVDDAGASLSRSKILVVDADAGDMF